MQCAFAGRAPLQSCARHRLLSPSQSSPSPPTGASQSLCAAASTRHVRHVARFSRIGNEPRAAVRRPGANRGVRGERAEGGGGSSTKAKKMTRRPAGLGSRRTDDGRRRHAAPLSIGGQSTLKGKVHARNTETNGQTVAVPIKTKASSHSLVGKQKRAWTTEDSEQRERKSPAAAASELRLMASSFSRPFAVLLLGGPALLKLGGGTTGPRASRRRRGTDGTTIHVITTLSLSLAAVLVCLNSLSCGAGAAGGGGGIKAGGCGCFVSKWSGPEAHAAAGSLEYKEGVAVVCVMQAWGPVLQ